MRCLTRYVLLEFIKVFVVGLVAMTILMVLGVMAQEAIRKGLGPENLFRLVPYTLPIALLYAIPATTLFATCSVFGRMASSNEIVAIKSLGISPMAILWPIFTLAFLLSLLVVVLNDVAVTWGRDGVKKVVLESVEQIAYGMLRTQRSYSCKRFSINVKRVEGKRLIRPTFTFYADNSSEPIIFTAEEAELRSDLAANTLFIRLSNWELDGGSDQLRMVWPATREFPIPLADAAHKVGRAGRPSDIGLRSIGPSIRTQVREMEQLEQAHAAEAAYQMLTGDFEALTDSSWAQRHQARQDATRRLHRLHTEPLRRWANGFSCLAFVVLGAPLAIRMRNSDVWTSFAVCFLPILGIYYPLLAYGVDQSKSGALPPFSVWLGNVVLMGLGALAIRRVLRF